MSNLRHRVGGKLEAMGDKLEAVEEKSKDLIHGFVGLFGRDGRIVSENLSHTVELLVVNKDTPDRRTPALIRTLCGPTYIENCTKLSLKRGHLL